MVRYRPEQVFVPASWVQVDELFVGRAEELSRAQDALRVPGLNVIIYGARGLGKTTLGRKLEQLETTENVVWIDCDQTWSLRNFIGRLLNKLEIEHEIRTKTVSDGAGGGISTKGVPFVQGHATREIRRTETTRSYQDAIYSVDYIADRLGDLTTPTVVILDEFDTLFHSDDYHRICRFLVQLIKACAGRTPTLVFRFVIIGVGGSVRSLIGEHGSIERNILELPIGKISKDYIGNFLRIAESLTGFHFETGVSHHFVEQADGYPYFIHFLGLECCRLAQKRGTDLINFEIYESAFERCFAQQTRIYRTRIEEKQRQLSPAELSTIFAFAADRAAQSTCSYVARTYMSGEKFSVDELEEAAKSLSKDEIFLYFDKRTKKYGFVDPIMKVFLRERAYFKNYHAALNDRTRRQLDLFQEE